MANEPKVAYESPVFADYIEPLGFLTRDIECHACFYYGMLAHKARLAAGRGPEDQMLIYNVNSAEEKPRWLIARDVEIAKSVAIIYGLESPAEFLPFKKRAWAQAAKLGVSIDPAVFEVSPLKVRLDS